MQTSTKFHDRLANLVLLNLVHRASRGGEDRAEVHEVPGDVLREGAYVADTVWGSTTGKCEVSTGCENNALVFCKKYFPELNYTNNYYLMN